MDEILIKINGKEKKGMSAMGISTLKYISKKSSSKKTDEGLKE